MNSVSRWQNLAVGGFVLCLLPERSAKAQGLDEPQAPRYWPTHTADESTGTSSAASAPPRDTRNEVPIVAYTYNAAGAPAKTVGAQGYGVGMAASGQDAVLGGGVSVWGAPIDRLTLVGDASRNVWGNFAPSAAVVVRILGDGRKGFTLGGLGKFKVDGFASGPKHDEVETELEIGALGSFAGSGWHLDLNTIMGRGLGDDGEMDAEGRFRVGYDVGRFVRLGLDSQGRVRVAGPKYLPNGRTWDFAAGTQVTVAVSRFFGAFTAGPTTMGLVSDSVGASAVLSFGGTT
jgi:hypothetical protein